MRNAITYNELAGTKILIIATKASKLFLRIGIRQVIENYYDIREIPSVRKVILLFRMDSPCDLLMLAKSSLDISCVSGSSVVIYLSAALVSSKLANK
jgi:hypothetical protein